MKSLKKAKGVVYTEYAVLLASVVTLCMPAITLFGRALEQTFVTEAQTLTNTLILAQNNGLRYYNSLSQTCAAGIGNSDCFSGVTYNSSNFTSSYINPSLGAGTGTGT